MHIAFCAFLQLQSARSVWRQSCRTHGIESSIHVAICTERVEAKDWLRPHPYPYPLPLQSARSVWRQRSLTLFLLPIFRCNLHGACGGKASNSIIKTKTKELQSARSVWRQRPVPPRHRSRRPWLQSARSVWRQSLVRLHTRVLRLLQSARSVWRQSTTVGSEVVGGALQSARSVWRQSALVVSASSGAEVAICTERVEAKGTC